MSPRLCCCLVAVLAIPIVAAAECSWVLWAAQEVSVKADPASLCQLV
jgi:hypothetical protein